jgi:hypothetical protein
MYRQLIKVCWIGLLISLTASFTRFSIAVSSLADESSRQAAFHDAIRIMSAAGDLADTATTTERWLTTKEVVVAWRRDWAGEVAADNAAHQQILHIDGLSMGIINQFPKQFD